MDTAKSNNPRRGQCLPHIIVHVVGCSSEDLGSQDAPSLSAAGSPIPSESCAQISVEILPPYPPQKVQGTTALSLLEESRPDVCGGRTTVLAEKTSVLFEEHPVQKMVKQTTLSAPDGGLRPWLSILACLCLLFVSSGMGKSFGDIKKSITAEIQCSHTVLIMIPGVFSAATLFWAPVSAALIRLFGARLMLTVGGALCAFGFAISGSADSGEYLIVSLGLVVGLGFSIVANYTVFVIGKLFKNRKPLALGLALTGGCIGHELLPRIFGLTLPVFGPRGIFGFLAVGSLLVIMICLCIVGDPESQMVSTVTLVPAPAEIEVPAPEADVSSHKKRLNRVRDELGLSILANHRFWLVAVSAVFFGLGSSAMGSAMKFYGEFPGFDIGEVFCLLSGVVVRLTYGPVSANSKFDRTAEYATAVVAATVAFASLLIVPSDARWVSYIVGALCTGAWAVLIPATLGSTLGAANIGKSFALLKLCRGFVMACWLIPKSELTGLLGIEGLIRLDFAFCVVAALIAILLYKMEKKQPETRSPEPEKIPEDSLIGFFFLYSL